MTTIFEDAIIEWAYNNKENGLWAELKKNKVIE